MGWFSSKPEQASAATRHDRQRCWESRDLYFDCLDGAGVLKAGDEGDVCAKEKRSYEANCAKSWIDYFNKRRMLAVQQKDMLAQAQTQARGPK
ncbi:cytochrome oxidase c subunit VIb-domain-containing protein [Pisolithus orientalis]|uniref:cytochrome oxidase c subunit VIb-domain-containing protein n=1 Tax=Pisolithus orientalis TaxID=936130 RepID=UPI0022255735|nr:cytochrome oxidase c subunit VIb-domain-containing protein [Pisolithus orientalis]KAI6025766.1 cytochrome oxidase c subunit VIb-domain-containing protein [Pisolithus orientalis]